MVSSQLTPLIKNEPRKSSKNQSPSPVSPLDEVEFDFSDVFGPLPPHHASSNDSSDEDFENPAVISIRSHSLVGPSPHLSKLNIHEKEDLYDVVIAEEHHEEDLVDYKVQSVGLEDFEVMKVVGKGAFGKVFQVRKKDSCEIYAMKVIRKDKILERNQAEYMKAERDILTKIDHPFVVQLRYSFQTKYRLYLVLDFVNGGHLFFQLHRHGLFREDLARIYAAEIVSAVCHLHANGIMHRDLKPENILLDAEGHALLTDFGMAKEFDTNGRSNSLCGTVEYMSPEIILGKGHDKLADWWSVGVLLYEMLTGQPPFRGGNREKIQRKIVKEKMKLPAYLSSEAHSILKALLQKDPSKRLGSGEMGSEEIKRHKWFKIINWKKLEGREIQPSFRPEVAGNHCVANFDKCWTDMPLTESPASSPSGSTTLFQRSTIINSFLLLPCHDVYASTDCKIMVFSDFKGFVDNMVKCEVYQ
ncbi:hypothetical protein LXL04_035944 [Taraxacum kok-saghyz]